MEYLDFYGTTYSLNTFGKPSYKTGFSFAASLITTVLVAVGTWLIGRDMFYKTNPKVVESTLLPDKTEPVYVNNANFTIAFRLEGPSGEPPKEEETYAFPHFYYEMFKVGDNGYLGMVFGKIYTPVPCTETEATKNPKIMGQNPETLNCFDISQIKRDLLKEGLIEPDKDIDLYGEFQEDYVSAFYLIYNNCKYINGEIDTSSCVSYEEAVKRNSENVSITFYIPRLAFAPENYEAPFIIYYDTVFFLISPYTSVVYRMKYSLVVLNDDRGWIFEDIHRLTSIDLITETKEYRFITKEAFATNSANMAIVDINFQRKQLLKTRIYMKLTEVIANMGGLLKGVVVFFNFVIRMHSTFRIETDLIRKHMRAENLELNRNRPNSSINQLKQGKIEHISLWSYVKMKFNSKLTKQKQIIKKIREKLDVDCLFEFLISLEKNRAPAEGVISMRNRRLES